MAGIGTVGVQDVDADGATDFTVRGRRRPLVERPVEREDTDGDTSPFCVLDIETTGFSPARDSIIEIAVIRNETEDGIPRERVLNELVRPSGNISKRIRELTGITNEIGGGRGRHRPGVVTGRRVRRRRPDRRAQRPLRPQVPGAQRSTDGNDVRRERMGVHHADGATGAAGRTVSAGSACREVGCSGAGQPPCAR